MVIVCFTHCILQTTEPELKQFFSCYGAVKDSKIIADRAGVSKGYVHCIIGFNC